MYEFVGEFGARFADSSLSQLSYRPKGVLTPDSLFIIADFSKL
jgi:hypothetical protein